MQQPRPGLVVSLVRSLVLIVPLTWLGMRIAPQLKCSILLSSAEPCGVLLCKIGPSSYSFRDGFVVTLAKIVLIRWNQILAL